MNPNEALTPYHIGEEMVYVPVVEYYIYANLTPQQALARYALCRELEARQSETQE